MITMNKPFTDNQVAAMVDLFKLIPATRFVRGEDMTRLAECYQHGFLVITEGGAVVQPIPTDLFELINTYHGTDTYALNQTFHKSFKTMAEGDIFELIEQQLLNYFSTYGLEAFGMTAANYVPEEALNMPFPAPNRKLVIIRTANNGTIFDAIDNFAKNVAAPSPRMVAEFGELLEFVSVDTDQIKSFELRVMKHTKDGTVPTEPTEFLRYLVYRTTGQTLVIKNSNLISAIKNRVGSYNYGMLEDNQVEGLFAEADLTSLASIFFRYKPIFLAFKKYPGCAPYINRIRRLAEKYHKPLSDVNVRNFTTLVREYRMDDVLSVLSRASNRELIKLGNAIGARLLQNQGESIPGVYSIRNGRTFVRADGLKGIPTKDYAHTFHVLELISDELVQRLSPSLKGKIFVIPDGISYSAPFSEKQFIGNIPWGTQLIGLPEGAFTAGIQWFNQDSKRIDIDLHLNSATTHYGWCGGWRDGTEVIYSGDQTNAPLPKGAAEAFFFNPAQDEAFILGANLYSGPEVVDYKMFISRQPVEAYARDYTFDPNEAVMAPIPLRFDHTHDMTIGMFANGAFYFMGGSIGHGIVPSGNYADYLKGLVAQLDARWTLTEVINACGGTVASPAVAKTIEAEDPNHPAIIDLSPEALTATTLLDLIDGKLE